jgi:MoaA/NifB/PqqE/SkfB family radical SAM enzyme
MLKEELIQYDPPTGRVATPPRQIFLELTSRCNLACVTCSVDYGLPSDDHRDMSLETVDRLMPWLTEALSVNLNVVGEPLIHPHLLEVIERLPSSAPRVHFNTNGLGLTPRMSRALVGSSVATIAVSIDGTQANDPIRGVAYEVLRARILTLLRAREEARADHPRIGIAYTLMRKNLHELVPVMEDLLPYGVDFVHVQPLVVFYEALLPQSIVDPSEARAVLGRARHLADRLGRQLIVFRSNFDSDERHQGVPDDDLQVGGVSRRFGCIDPFYEIKIRADGTVLSCSYGLSCGLNVNRLELDAIWNHPWYCELRRRLYAGIFEGRCHGCPYVSGSPTCRSATVRPGVRHSQEAHFFQGG